MRQGWTIGGRLRLWALGALAALVLGAGCTGAPPPPQPTDGAPMPGGTPASPATPMPQPAPPADAPRPQPPAAGNPPAAPAAPPQVAIPDLDGRSLREWVVDLMSDDPKVRERAAARVEQLGLRGAEPLIALTHEPRPEVRRGAVFALLKDLHPDEGAKLAAFVRLLDDPEASVRSVALQGLASLDGPALVAHAPHFARVLADGQAPATLRADAARALGRIGPAAPEALKPLLAAAEGATDPRLQAAAFAALGKVAPTAAEVLPLAQSLVRGSDPALRRAAVRRLGEIGPAAAPAVADLVAVLGDTDNSTAKSAADALVKIGPATVKPLIAALDSPQRQVKILAIYALGMIGPPAQEATVPLQKAALGGDELIQQAAADALLRIQGP